MARTFADLTAEEILAISQLFPLEAGEFLTNDGTNLSWAAAGGSFAWGATANGASGTGLALSVDNSSASSTIGQSITIGNTQTNACIGSQIDTGTDASPGQVGAYIKALNTGTGNGVVGGLVVNCFSALTQAVTDVQSISVGNTFNTNSGFSHYGISVSNRNNTGAGKNTGIYINNSSVDFTLGANPSGSGLHIFSTGTAISVYSDDSINLSTNGLVNYSLSTTQSGATVVQKIDLSSAAQGHTGLQILAYGASTSQRGVTIDTSSTGTGIPVELITAGTGRTALKLSTGFTSSTAPAGASTYVIVDIGGTAYKMLAQAVA